MKKNILIIVIALIVVCVGVISYFLINKNQNITKIDDFKNATYIIDGRSITLVNGLSEVEIAPGSVSKIITRYFGNEVRHDLNDDGREDVAFILTQETGGSGVFYYVVAALNTSNGYVGSQAFLLGDRIAPQTTEIDEGLTARGTNRQNVIVVNYAVRLPNEPFTTPPSVGKSVWLKLDPATMQFGEVAQNFEGESNSVKKCFKQIFADKSVISAEFTFTGNLVEGPLSYLWAQKDNSIGVFKGVLKDGLITGDDTFMSEGQESVGKTVFRYDGKSLIQGFGQDLNEFNGAVTLNQVICSEK